MSTTPAAWVSSPTLRAASRARLSIGAWTYCAIWRTAAQRAAIRILAMAREYFSRHRTRSLSMRAEWTFRNGANTGWGWLSCRKAERRRARCEEIIEATVQAEGQRFLGWRDVPVDESRIGKTARAVRPVIRQFFVGRGSNVLDQASLERKLYVIRKVVESTVAASDMKGADDFYISSLSSNTVVYKGLLTGTQVEHFYLDLKNPHMESGFAMVHSRFSTNTLGSWKLAHPYRYISHNGEINTLRGNINWMTARESLFSSPLFGDDVKKLFPIITPRASDTANFDNALELLVLGGRTLSHAMMMMIPEAWNGNRFISAEKRAFYEYHANLMEPWDGPCADSFHRWKEDRRQPGPQRAAAFPLHRDQGQSAGHGVGNRRA